MEKKSDLEWRRFFNLCYKELIIEDLSFKWMDDMDELIITDDFIDGIFDELEDEQSD